VLWLRIKEEAICISWSLHVSGHKLHLFLTSALHGGEWSASRFGRITVVVRASGFYQIGGWVGPDLVKKLQRRDESLHFIENSLQIVWTVSLSNFLDISQLGTRATLVLFHDT
jgi:hypothetical protein